MYGGVAAFLLVLIILMVWVAPRLAGCGECAQGLKVWNWLGKKRGGAEGMTMAETRRALSKIDRVFGKEDLSTDPGPAYNAPSDLARYDPLQMGALKQTEVDAHKRGLREMSPFASYGPAGSQRIIRDDDEYTRNTGVVWIGGRPRTVNKVMSGPQAGARQVTSTSEKDIRVTHIKSMTEPTTAWNTSP